MDLELRGKSVIVTGGGSNIGRAIVLAFAAEGANITIGEIDLTQGGRVAESAKAAGAAGVELVECDVTDYGQVQNLVQSAVDRCGGVDVLVSNVGWDQLGFFSESTPDFWQKLIQVNYVGNLNCTHAVLGAMLQARRGAIVSISSDTSRQGEAGEAVHSGLAAGINCFMKSVARENGRYGIRCNVVCPGLTVPENEDAIGAGSAWSNPESIFSEEQLAKIVKRLPLKKGGEARDVANAVLFLASDAAAGHVTGQVLSVSGGYTMTG